MNSKEKVEALRKEMQKNNIDAFIVFSSDPHMSEYAPEEWKERQWLSGFKGSAGFVVITKDKGGLWTDGRYFTQANIELKGSGIDLFKDGIEGTPNYVDWIISQTPENGTVAVNGLTTSNVNWEILDEKLTANHRKLKNLPLLDHVWTQRTAPSKNPVFVHPIERAGLSVEEKLSKIRQKMEEHRTSVHIISTLDDIAWTLNLRGSDVEANPVFLSYLIITKNDALLFVDLDKLDVPSRKQLDEAYVKMLPYGEFYKYLSSIKDETILISPNSNQLIFETLKANNKIVKAQTPGHVMKAKKNSYEIDGFRTVMIRDGVAMVNFLYWLTHNAGKEPMNEYSIGQKLHEFRAKGKNFVGDSFNAIVGFKENGAIIHYSAKNSGSKEVTNDGSILIDSGAQYLEGTTDLTRTFALGKVSEEFKHDSTLVLKGMISLSMVKFPKGTRGVQLDAFARLPLWKEGKDYNHGTGHGVGSFMNVHEGPQNFRKDMNPQELLEGMVISNEPGYYVEGKYGIRHENLLTVKEWKKTEWNTFYEFETLTFCPFFKDTIVKELLSKEEIDWFNQYQKKCGEKLGDHLEGDVKKWFLELISPL